MKICETTVRPEGEPLPKIRMRVQPIETPLPSPIPASPHSSRLTLTNSNTTKITLPPRCKFLRLIIILKSLTNCSLLSAGASTPLSYSTYDNEPELATPVEKKKLKIKLPPKLEKSQASGMPMSDVASCKSMIKKVLKEKVSLMFRAPVGKFNSFLLAI